MGDVARAAGAWVDGVNPGGPDCIFCRIIAGQSPASRVWEDADTLAFMDIRPVTPGHLLVIPKRHAACLAELTPQETGRIFTVARSLAGALRSSGLRCEGINLLLADGEVAGQEVFHVHVHVLPRFSGDGFGFHFAPYYSRPPERAVLDEWASRIRAALGPPGST
jgi:histidine triad (HIT) family protein